MTASNVPDQLAELAVATVLTDSHPTHRPAKTIISRAIAKALQVQRQHLAGVAQGAAAETDDPVAIRDRVLAG